MQSQCSFLFLPGSVLEAFITGQKLPGSVFSRPAEDFFGSTLLDNHAFIHENNPVGHITGKIHFMGHNDHACILVSQIFYNFKNFTGQFRIKG